MSNTISSDLQLTTVLESAMRAFKRAILPVTSFSTVFRDTPLRGTDTIAVPYYALATSNSQTRASNGSYKALATSTTTSSKTIQPTKNKVQAISFTSQERNRQPAFNPEMHGQLKGEKLAYDVLADILSVVRAADFDGTTIAATAASNFDEDDVAELAQYCMEGNWPESGRSLILNPGFYFNLLKQPAILDASQSGSVAALREASVRRVLGFDVLGSNGMPTNTGTAFAVTGEADDDTITAVAHGLIDGDRVNFPTLTGGSGLTASTGYYYVINADDDTFQVSATAGGAAVNFTTDISSGTCKKAENLAGMAVGPSAILCAFAPVEPSEAMRKLLADYRLVDDRDSGLRLEYKHLVYPDTDEEVQVIECHYGYALGETAALKRIITA